MPRRPEPPATARARTHLLDHAQHARPPALVEHGVRGREDALGVAYEQAAVPG